MDLITAIKSGRPFRRKEYADKMDYIRLPKEGFNTLNLAIGDIVADDWETEEVKVEITESEFWELAADQLSKTLITMGITYHSPKGMEHELMVHHVQRIFLPNLGNKLFGKEEK